MFTFSAVWMNKHLSKVGTISMHSRVADPDLFGRIRIRKIFTGTVSGSGSYQYFGNVKLYKQGKNIFKKEVLHIFRWIFPFFQIKIIIIQISEIICLMWKKCWCLNWFLVSASRIQDPGSGSRAVSRSGFLNSDLLDPDPAENGPDPQPCFNGSNKGR